MPRPTLPKCVERVATMNVLITQHSENDVWFHMCRMSSLLEMKGRGYWQQWNDFVNKMFNNNPYEKYTIQDWRFNRVNRITVERWREDWSEEEMEEFMLLTSISRDLDLCENAFEWSKTKPEFFDMKNDAERFKLHFITDEFKMYESVKYNNAFKKYKTDDAEYIAERNYFRNHEDSHISGNLPTQKTSAYAYEVDEKYRNNIIEAKKTCRYCIELARLQKDREEAEAEQIRKQEEDNKNWIKEQAEKRKQEEAQMRRPSRMHSCDDCDYHTTSLGQYDNHMESREHKAVENRKKWFCKDCGIQSRSTQEYEFHIRSKKHLKAVGELNEEEKETQVFECKACSYTTPYKQVYQTHMKSAKHLKNTT